MKLCILALALLSLLMGSRSGSKEAQQGDRDEKATEVSMGQVKILPKQILVPVVNPQPKAIFEAIDTVETIAKITSDESNATLPSAGEQIRWQVMSSGGGVSASTNFTLGLTVGQPAVGRISSTNYVLLQGFWQSFEPASCCNGTTGNVNKSVAETPDLSDLSLLIAFLTVTPKPTLPCLPEANVNASVAPNPDLSDLSLLIAFLTVTPKPTLPNCPS